jgi:hypothetical protein
MPNIKTACLIAALMLASGAAIAQTFIQPGTGITAATRATVVPTGVYLVIEEIRRTLPGDGYVPTPPLGPMPREQCEQLRPTYEGWPGTASVACKPAVGWQTCRGAPSYGMTLTCPVFDN